MRTLFFFSHLFLISNLSVAQILEENLRYCLEKLTIVLSTCTKNPTGPVDIDVASGNLRYKLAISVHPDYLSL